jgi:hypothetical protein
MPSLQSKLETSSLEIRKLLWNQQVELTGKESKVLRLKLSRNDYGDATEMTILSKDDITIYIDYPGLIPLIRKRSDTGFQTSIQSTNLYMWDILPIGIYAKWEDQLEKGDIILDQIKNEGGDYSPIILQVSDEVGTFKTNLLYIKYLAAPYNEVLPDEVMSIVDHLNTGK